jgi:hypothetical protein
MGKRAPFAGRYLSLTPGFPELTPLSIRSVPIDPDTTQRFTINQPEEPTPKPVTVSKEAAPKSRRQFSYNMIGRIVVPRPWIEKLQFSLDSTLLRDIKTFESFGDFGSKIQTLVCHLLYLQMTDPGAKSIVFSAWADSLHSAFVFPFCQSCANSSQVLEQALKANGKSCSCLCQQAAF